MHIIGIAGAKQSGKSSACNFLAGQTLKDYGRIETLKMAPNGRIIVNTVYDVNGVQEVGEGELDFNRKDEAFYQYSVQNIWPYVKIYAIADKLKEQVCSMFDIDINLAYGTDDDKNTLTKVKKEAIYKFLDKSTVKELKSDTSTEFLTIRQVLMYYGSDMCRNLYEDCWINPCLEQIQYEQPSLALICDVRFPNEVAKIQALGGKVIYLTRDKFKSNHESEKLLRELPRDIFDGVVDNENVEDINVKNDMIIEVLNNIIGEKP